MRDPNDHVACVDAWIIEKTRDLAPDETLRLFEAVCQALWERSRARLSEVTLMAIGDRLLYEVRERFPVLDGLELGSRGISLERLRERAAEPLDPDEFRQALRLVLLEFLMVLGRLTAETLTPALHEALMNVSPDDRGG